LAVIVIEYCMKNSAGQTGKKLLALYDDVAGECVDCGLCQKDCRFLQKYGSPGSIARQRSLDRNELRMSFECSLCRLCTVVCPKDVDPVDMFGAMRCHAQETGQATFAKHGVILRYERWGASAPISWYGLPEGCDTVLFPGCAMAGSRSERVVDLYRHLQREIPSLGVVLDCCTKPSHDLGRKEYFFTMFYALRDSLVKHGVQQVLVACPSCYRVWKDYGGPVRVRSIYELLVESGPLETISSSMEVTVHDPCPTRNDSAIHEAVRGLLTAMGFSLREMKHHGRKTICCGEGGAACFLAPDIVGNWSIARAQEAAGQYMVTYCAGCIQFLGRRAAVGHVADRFFDPAKTLAGRVRIARSPVTWLKRLLLNQKFKNLVVAKMTGRRGAGGRVELTRSSE
jgi:Fe-S oxidoreductase